MVLSLLGLRKITVTNYEPYAVFPEGKYADNTVLLFQKQWRNWVDYCCQNDLQIFPVKETNLLKYLENKDWKYATIKVVIEALKAVHRNQKVPITFMGEGLENYLKQRLRQRAPQKQAKGLRINDLIRILNHSSIKLKHKAIVSLMFDTLCRRSEIVAIKWDDFRVEQDEYTESEAVVLRVPRSKTNQYGQYDDYRYVSDHTWAMLQIIREQQPECELRPFPIVEDTINKLFKRVSEKLSIEPKFTAHSCRVGAAQELAKFGASDLEIRRAGGWSSTAMVNRYTRHLGVQNMGMARYFEQLPLDIKSKIAVL